jgi:hypothetical protein
MNHSGDSGVNLSVMRGRLSILVCVAFSLAACGGGHGATSTTTATGMSADAWAGGVCTALNTYEQGLQSAVTAFTQNPSKSGIKKALTKAEQETRNLSESLKALGKPNTASGQAARQTIDNLATTISADMSTIKQAASGSKLQAATTVSSTLGSMKTSATTSVNKLQSLNGGELKSAFASAPSCAKFSSKK